MADPISIPLTGLAASDPIPGVYTQIDFAQGAPSGASAVYGALLIGNKLSTGDATADSVVYGPFGSSPLPLQTEQDAIDRFGRGSELHRMWRRFVKKNTATPVYAIAVAESAGTQATKVINISVTATASGNARCWVGDEFVDTAIVLGDTPQTIAGNIATSVNSKADWAATASSAVNGSGPTYDITIKARQKGPRGNWLRCSIVVTGSGVGTISDTVTQSYLTSGATADDSTTALATIAATRFYYLVSAAEDSTQLGALATQVDSQALPTTGIRQTIIGASIDTEGNAQTIAVALNQARAEIPWMEQADRPPSEIAADMAALYALGELPDGTGGPSRHNFDSLGLGATALDGLWDMPFPRSGKVNTSTTIAGALNNGLSPISSDAYGHTYLVMRATTRSLTSSVSDYRIRDPHKVRVCDFYADSLQSKLALQFGAKDIVDNPAKNQVYRNPNLVWPDAMKAAVNKQTQEWSDDGQLQNGAQIKAATVVIREASPTTRMSMRIPLQTVDVLHQIGVDIQQVA